LHRPPETAAGQLSAPWLGQGAVPCLSPPCLSFPLFSKPLPCQPRTLCVLQKVMGGMPGPHPAQRAQGWPPSSEPFKPDGLQGLCRMEPLWKERRKFPSADGSQAPLALLHTIFSCNAAEGPATAAPCPQQGTDTLGWPW